MCVCDSRRTGIPRAWFDSRKKPSFQSSPRSSGRHPALLSDDPWHAAQDWLTSSHHLSDTPQAVACIAKSCMEVHAGRRGNCQSARKRYGALIMPGLIYLSRTPQTCIRRLCLCGCKRPPTVYTSLVHLYLLPLCSHALKLLSSRRLVLLLLCFFATDLGPTPSFTTQNILESVAIGQTYLSIARSIPSIAIFRILEPSLHILDLFLSRANDYIRLPTSRP